jgi:hypothetical protein
MNAMKPCLAMLVVGLMALDTTPAKAGNCRPMDMF